MEHGPRVPLAKCLVSEQPAVHTSPQESFQHSYGLKGGVRTWRTAVRGGRGERRPRLVFEKLSEDPKYNRPNVCGRDSCGTPRRHRGAEAGNGDYAERSRSGDTPSPD